MPEAERLTVAALERKIAEHAPSPTYRQCRCGHTPAEDCWQRATWQKLLDELRAAAQSGADVL